MQPFVTAFLLLLGVGFLIANARVLLDYLTFRKRRDGALLVWSGPKTPYQGIAVAIAVVLGLLIVYKLLVLRQQVFGETMMFAYYVYLLPLSRRIGRGFYEDGIWADRAFIRYHDVGGITWREGERDATLIVISRLRNLARRLNVPGDKYSAARRLLREKIGQRTIQLARGGLDLGGHDDRDDV